MALEISESDLGFYDTPEYCFHDYIPERKNDLTLLICENKDIWLSLIHILLADKVGIISGGILGYEGALKQGDNLEDLFMNVVRKNQKAGEIHG